MSVTEPSSLFTWKVIIGITSKESTSHSMSRLREASGWHQIIYGENSMKSSDAFWSVSCVGVGHCALAGVLTFLLHEQK